MKEAKNVLLTFDYEPYLGAKSGSAEKCIIQPANELYTILAKYKAQAVFFVDVLYLLHLKEQAELKKDFLAITDQLKKLHAEGHYIFPHIHPHWLDAVYLPDRKEFSLTDLSRYSLANLGQPKINELFREASNFLKDIGISYVEWGYRAGGWCIQPFHNFKEIFERQNIKYEFSVLPGYKNDNPSQAFDFLNVTQKEPYHFSNEIEKTDEQGSFIEFPISALSFNKIALFNDRLLRKYLWKINDRGWGDGTSAQTAALKSDFSHKEMVSIDVLTIAKLKQYKKYLSENDYMHWISHPKMFTKHGLKTFDKFLKFGTAKFDLIFDFKKMIPKNK